MAPRSNTSLHYLGFLFKGGDMKTKVDLKKWSRYETFKHYDMCTNPFIIVSVNIDITNLYNYAKEKKLSMYSAMGHMITKTARTFG